MLLTVPDGPLVVRFPGVSTTLEESGRALLTVACEVINLSPAPVVATITGSIDGGTNFSQEVHIS